MPIGNLTDDRRGARAARSVDRGRDATLNASEPEPRTMRLGRPHRRFLVARLDGQLGLRPAPQAARSSPAVSGSMQRASSFLTLFTRVDTGQ